MRLYALPAALLCAIIASCASAPDVPAAQSLGSFNYRPDSGSSRTYYTVHRPQDTQTRPAVVIIHGGGWQRGEPSDMQDYVDRVVAEGWVAINLAYRLAPKHTWPAQRDDLYAALTSIHANADKYGLDPSRIAVLGYSAGAHLAAIAALESPPRLLPPVAWVGGAGPYDLTQYPQSKLVNALLGGVPAAVGSSIYRDASLLLKVHSLAPPAFLWHGNWDLLVDQGQSERMALALKAYNVPVVLRERTARGHLSNFLLGKDDWAEIASFLRGYLEPDPGP